MKNIILIFYTFISAHCCIAQTDTITDKQFIAIFADLPLSKTKETWKIILENQKEKYLDTLTGITKMSSFIINDLSFYQTISPNVNKGYIRISDPTKTNSSKTGFDTFSIIDIYLHLRPGITKKEAKTAFQEFRKILARNYSNEHPFSYRGGEIYSFTYSNYRIGWAGPIHFSLVKIKEKNIYSIAFTYQKTN